MENILRFLIFINILLGMGVWSYWYIKNKTKKGYAIAPLAFLLNGLLFSVFAGLNLLPKETFIIWRDLVSIHGLIIITTTGIIFIQLIGGNK